MLLSSTSCNTQLFEVIVRSSFHAGFLAAGNAIEIEGKLSSEEIKKE